MVDRVGNKDEKFVVTVERSCGDPLTGVVLASGRRWIVLHALRDLQLANPQAVRRRDVTRLKVDKRNGYVAERALLRSGFVPEDLSSLDLDDTGGALRSMASLGSVITIHPEQRWPGSCHLGELGQIDPQRKRFELWEITPRATWDARPHRWRFRDVTLIEARDAYSETIAALAGPRPRRLQRVA